MPEMLVLQDLPTVGVIMGGMLNGYAHELTGNQQSRRQILTNERRRLIPINYELYFWKKKLSTFNCRRPSHGARLHPNEWWRIRRSQRI